MKFVQRSFFSVLCLFAFSGCAAQTIRGAVVDKDTEKPIPGVIVYSYWTHYGGFVDSRSSCVRVDFATTDQNGRYELPSPYIPSKEMVMRMGVYKAGYEEHLDIDPKGGYAIPYKGQEGERWLMMKPFEGTVKERLEYLEKQHGKECGASKEYSIKVRPFYAALYEEGKNLKPASKEEREIASGLLFSVERLELGTGEALKRLQERQMKGTF